VGYPQLTGSRRQSRLTGLILLLLILLIGARTIASFIIDFAWWKEMGQLSTWISMLLYRVTPVIAASLIAFAVLLLAHARALRFAEAETGGHPWYRRIAALILLGVAVLVSVSSVDTWTVVRFFGGLHLPAEARSWQDAVFNKPLTFYFFDLPFYEMLRRYLLAVTIAAAFVYWMAARGWQLKDKLPEIQQSQEVDPALFRLEGALESKFLRGAAAVFLVALAISYFLGRYELLFADHGFMVGVDYVNRYITLPLQWLVIVSCLVSAVFIWLGRWLLAGSVIVAIALQVVVPRIVDAAYVRPNEMAVERPYIQTHIEATRSAYGLDRRSREVEYEATTEAKIDPAKHRALFDNIRLWDWRAFHDTITQIQALRTYYVFADSDVDRYIIDGNLRQVMVSPRELDINQLPDAQLSWINSHFIYTHGYGMVMADANRITAEGLPKLFIKDAPPVAETKSLQLTRPEIYYGEMNHEPVFVNTGQREFNYPSGDKNVFSTYEGSGGIPISSIPMRVVAAIAMGDVNIVLNAPLTPGSRMMIRRNVRRRLQELAGFITWDSDPYLVLTDEGRMVWVVDGYTSSRAHPYSRGLSVEGPGTVNYIRNSVKATVDAYTGKARLYVFDPADPIIEAYWRLFPKLLTPMSEMPEDLRRHMRYPMLLFRVQAEIYRIYHMRDPRTFYNKEDVWDVAKNIQGQQSRPEPNAPTYVVANLPGEDHAEFFLILPFAPRNKDNLVGLMVARCDGEHLGELLFLQLSKEKLFFGTMQIEARINQSRLISKDLSLWNQQGSRVLRGQMLVFPVEHTLIYVEPLYIQASEARMPQLRKVILAMGNQLIYRDSYEEAVAELAALSGFGQAPPGQAPVLAQAAPGKAPPAPSAPDPRLRQIRQHLRRYQELAGEGQWAEAGKELEAIEGLVQQ